jgi:hypothetical protein
VNVDASAPLVDSTSASMERWSTNSPFWIYRSISVARV